MRTSCPQSASGPLRVNARELAGCSGDTCLLGPAEIALERGGRGRMNFIAVDLVLDYKLARRDNLDGVEFTFDGSDEGDRVTGRGWAVLDGQKLRGRIHFHQGDSSGFLAHRITARPRAGRQGT